MTPKYTYEDFHVGRVFDMGEKLISREEIIEFATEFDPQPFHLDEESQQAEQVGGLIASGWHTCCILMRMMCDSYLCETASQGSGGLDEVRWLRPVRPGDVLTGTAEVLAARTSSSKPTLGLVTFVYTIKNQANEDVMVTKGMGFIETRAGAEARQ